MVDLPIPVTSPAPAARAGAASINLRGVAQRDGATQPGSADFPDALAQEVGIAAGQAAPAPGVPAIAAQANIAPEASDDAVQVAVAADGIPAFINLLAQQFSLTPDGQTSPGLASSATALDLDDEKETSDGAAAQAAVAAQAYADPPVLAPDHSFLAPAVPGASTALAPSPAASVSPPPPPTGIIAPLAPQGAYMASTEHALAGSPPGTLDLDSPEVPLARLSATAMSDGQQNSDDALNTTPSAADIAVTGKSQSGTERTMPALDPLDLAPHMASTEHALAGSPPGTLDLDSPEVPLALLSATAMSDGQQNSDDALNTMPSAADIAVTGKSHSGTAPALEARDRAPQELALARLFAAEKGNSPQDNDAPSNVTPRATDLAATDKSQPGAMPSTRAREAALARLSATATSDKQQSSGAMLEIAPGAADFAIPGQSLPAASTESRRDITFERSLAEQRATPVLPNTSSAYTAPAPLAPVPAAVLHPAVGDQRWSQGLGDQLVWMAGHKHQVAELHLNPPDLGPLKITLTLDNDKASAQFFSAHAVVREAIESAMPRLREMLADSGITLGNANVSAEPYRDPAQQQELRQEARAYFAPSASLTANVGTLAQGARLSRGLIDTFA